MDHRKKITGVVIGDKADKTIIVESEGYRKHPKYKKRVQFRNKYYAHDENNIAHVGDTVTIEESRPLSALKRFVLISVDQKAIASVEVEESEELKEVLHETKEEKSDDKEAE